MSKISVCIKNWFIYITKYVQASHNFVYHKTFLCLIKIPIIYCYFFNVFQISSNEVFLYMTEPLLNEKKTKTSFFLSPLQRAMSRRI